MGGYSGEGRGFREVDIAISSAVPGHPRDVPDENSEYRYPATWRNNLTALSQQHNLYFLVYGEQIHVYQPEFPTQRIGNSCFYWSVKGSGVGSQGIFRTWQSHWINRIVLEQLGYEEVIATVHDDGDFIVCTVRSVREAIHAFRYEGSSHNEAVARIKYLYIENIEASGWGIAIHTNARLLAASSNTHQVTVFAPALSQTGPWHPSLDAVDRSRDMKLILSGHKTNVPAIAFCNSIADPQGRYLVSTDISGEVIIWDIWKRCVIKQITMASSSLSLDEEYPGWSVTCLDPSCFQSAGSDLEFLGYDRTAHDSTAIDASLALASVRDFQLPNTTHRRTLFSTRLRSISRSSEDEMTAAGQWGTDDYDDEHITDNNDFEDGLGDDDWGEFDPDDFLPLRHTGIAVSGDDFESRDDLGFDSEELTDVFYDTVDFGPQPAPDEETELENFLQGRSESRNSLRLVSVPQPRSMAHSFSPQPWTMPPPAPQPPGLTVPFSILHTGQHVATLLRPPFCASAAHAFDPCREKPSRWRTDPLSIYERLNLTVCIPELSIVVIASQRGRAAIFSLTEQESIAPNRPRKDILQKLSKRRRSRVSAPRAGDNESKEPFTIRLDWIIPFASQQIREERPQKPLIGIAASPIQNGKGGIDGVGRESGKPTLRRWRLMLTYQDNTMLSYELSRGGGRNEELLVF